MDAALNKIRTGFFARHETFAPRYGWLKKGFDGVAGALPDQLDEWAESPRRPTGGDSPNPSHPQTDIPSSDTSQPPPDPGVFDRPDAIEILGVGKNMVRSIRFWCMAFHLIEPEKNPDSPRVSGPMRTTALGRALLAEGGWDPYLEDPASLWLLHWKLFAPPIVAPAWSIAVNGAAASGFSAKDLARRFIDYARDVPEFGRLSASSFEKDASCFVRMYAPPAAGKRGGDEIECPFTQLGFLVPAESKGHFRFHVGEKPNLPDLVFLAACLDFAGRRGGVNGAETSGRSKGSAESASADRSGADGGMNGGGDGGPRGGSKTLSLGAIAYEWNGPGRVFQLSETDIGHRLERAAAGRADLIFTESYGHRQLQFFEDPADIRDRLLAEYYDRSAGRSASRKDSGGGARFRAGADAGRGAA
ncbi:MAG: DUF4007 family protein [Desulfococcaceae bacterium]